MHKAENINRPTQATLDRRRQAVPVAAVPLNELKHKGGLGGEVAENRDAIFGPFGHNGVWWGVQSSPR
jgi:hypothetical protein